MGNNNKRQPMTEEEKKAKFGDKYDPNYKPQPKQGNEGKEPDTKIKKKKTGYGKGKQDWEWYAVDEQIAKDLGSLPFSVLSGVDLRLDGHTPTEVGNIATKYRWNSENVAVIPYLTPPTTTDEDGNTGIQLAANQLYTFIRHANSGARNYEPADVMMYVLAMGDVYREMAQAYRILGTVQYFSFVNRALPSKMIMAMGIDYDDLKSNIANYRGEYNLLVKRVNSLAIPKYFKAFARAAFIASNWFMDSDSLRGQYIMFVKAGHYTYSPTSSESGTELTFTYDKPMNNIKFSQVLSRIKNMLLPIETDTDALTMSGDILKAFADSELYQFATMDENAVIVPLMNEDVLAQVENMITLISYAGVGDTVDSIVTKLQSGNSLNVKQNAGQIKCNPKMSGLTHSSTHPENVIGLQDYMFNSHKDVVDYKDVLDWTRLEIGVELESGSTTDLYDVIVESNGLELPLAYVVLNSEDSPVVLRQFLYQSDTDSMSVADFARITVYDWHPIVYVFDLRYDTKYVTVGGDLKKYTTISKSKINQLNRSANEGAYYAKGLYDKK